MSYISKHTASPLQKTINYCSSVKYSLLTVTTHKNILWTMDILQPFNMTVTDIHIYHCDFKHYRLQLSFNNSTVTLPSVRIKFTHLLSVHRSMSAVCLAMQSVLTQLYLQTHIKTQIRTCHCASWSMAIWPWIIVEWKWKNNVCVCVYLCLCVLGFQGDSQTGWVMKLQHQVQKSSVVRRNKVCGHMIDVLTENKQ